MSYAYRRRKKVIAWIKRLYPSEPYWVILERYQKYIKHERQAWNS